MLRSMTGFGEASHRDDRVVVSVDIRSVNNRYLKVNVKLPETHLRLESDAERQVRDRLTRGTVSVAVNVLHLAGIETHRLNLPVVEGYLRQLSHLASDPRSLLGAILTLPGAVEETLPARDVEKDGAVITAVLAHAIDDMEGMRLREGEAMKLELEKHCTTIKALATQIGELASAATEGYRDRLIERVNDLLAQRGVTVSAGDVVREVAIFADRTDISEEISRLKSHVEQFRRLMDGPEACGRKLDFLGQEMFRECNTMGAKSGDSRISVCVVDLKSTVERVREMIANVE